MSSFPATACAAAEAPGVRSLGQKRVHRRVGLWNPLSGGRRPSRGHGGALTRRGKSSGSFGATASLDSQLMTVFKHPFELLGSDQRMTKYTHGEPISRYTARKARVMSPPSL